MRMLEGDSFVEKWEAFSQRTEMNSKSIIS